MTQHVLRTPQGFIHYSTVDLEFEFEGKSTCMEFHHYCGPSFYHLNVHGEEEFIYPDEDKRWDALWETFDNWYQDNKDK